MGDFSANLSVEAMGTLDYGDMVMVNGDLVMTSDVVPPSGYPTGTNPVLQNIIQRLRTFLGEWFLDQTIGVGWYQELLTDSATSNAQVDTVLQNVVLNTPGVSQLVDWQVSLDRVHRVLSVSFKAVTTQGFINYSAPISVALGGQ